MTTNEPVKRDSSLPPPRPKRKWLRRLVILACCLLALFALWGILNVWMGSEFQREVDALRARGEPTSLAEMAPTAVLPREQDAAVLIRRAVAIYDANVKPLLDAMGAAVKAAGYEDASGNLVWFDPSMPADYPQLLSEFPTEVAAIRDAAKPVFALYRRARQLDYYDLGVDYADPQGVFSGRPPYYSQMRALARLSSLLAAEAHHRGDDVEAAECLRDCFVLSRYATECPILITDLTALAVETIAAPPNPNLLHQLRFGKDSADPARKAMKELTDLLLDANRHRERFVRCMVGERACSCTYATAVLGGTLAYEGTVSHVTMTGVVREDNIVDHTALRAIFRPALGKDAGVFLHCMSSVVAAAQQEDYPSAVAKLDFPPPSVTTVGRLLHPFMAWGIGYRDALQLHFRGVAGLRLAGAAIAVRMYELDKGRALARLEDLVPEYLPSLPKDPFDANGGPIRMGRWGGRELLYSIGQVGSDLGGQYGPDPNESPGWHFLENKYNWPYFLRGDGPRERIVQRTPQTSPSSDAGMPLSVPTESAPATVKP